MRVNNKPLKIPKENPSDENKRGRKLYRQVIEETWAHLVDLGQVIALSEI
jgi:hypothetical protein